VDEVGERLYAHFNEQMSGRKEKRPYGHRGQSGQTSASQPWGEGNTDRKTKSSHYKKNPHFAT
jgi:hypothetical protein